VLAADIQFVGYEMQERGISTLEEYQKVGGKDGIIATSIKSLIEAFPTETAREHVRRLLNALIDRDFGTRLQHPLSPDTLAVLSGASDVDALLKPFLDRRIVVPAGSTAANYAGYRLAHDYLVQPIYAATERTESEFEKLLRLLRHYGALRFRERGGRVPWRDYQLIRKLRKIFATDSRVQDAGREAAPALDRTRWYFIRSAVIAAALFVLATVGVWWWRMGQHAREERRVEAEVRNRLAQFQRGEAIPKPDEAKYGGNAEQSRANDLVAFAIIASDKYKDKDYVESLRYYLAANEIRDVAEIKARIADNYLELGYNDEAIAWEKEAIKLAPRWSGPYYIVGIAAWRKGDLGTARQYLESSCGLGFEGACQQLQALPK